MTRARYRFRTYTINRDEGPSAQPLTFAMQCAACGTTGPTSTHPDAPTTWAARHLKANPTHLTYREHITRPYRDKPEEWQ